MSIPNEDRLRDAYDRAFTHSDPHSPYYDGPFFEPDQDASSAWSPDEIQQLNQMATELDLISAEKERRAMEKHQRLVRLLMMSREATMVMATYNELFWGD